MGSLPLLASVLPDKQSFFLFPPLDTVFRTAAILLCVAVTFIVYFTSDLKFTKSGKRRFAVLFATVSVSVVGVGLFLVSHEQFVRTIDIPAKKETVTVSVGYTRTVFANRQFPNSTDWDMIRARGTSDEEIKRLWTEWSIIVARLALLFSYLLFLLPAIAAFSLGVLYQGLGAAPSP